ncbi:MAG: hypothetical protein ACKVWV_19905 [Planctomycetota bacterium]
MVLRKKNLLEAFQASAPEGRKAQARKRVEPVASGGPFAPGAPGGAAQSGAAAQPERRGSGSRAALARALGPRAIQIGLLALVGAIGAAYWLGRRSNVSASDPAAASATLGSGALVGINGTAPAPASEAGTAALNRQTAELKTAEDQALMDPSNDYTIRLIQYSNDERGLKQAHALYDHLRRKDLVPVVSPIVQGKIIVLVAGAAPRIKDLDALISYVRGLKGPNPKDGVLPFQDAFVVNIDDLVARER